jgi:hypothetical protein
MEAVRSRQAKRAFVAAWLVALAAAGGAGPARACDAASGAATTSGGSMAAQGMVVHRDPATGKLGGPPSEQPGTPGAPPPDAAMRAVPQAAPASVVALPETLGTTPAGGVTVDLQGHLESPMRATIGADGKPHVECAAPALEGTE